MIFLGLLGEIATIIASYAIIIKGGVDLTIKLCELGYKIDKKAFDKYQKQEKNKQSAAKKKRSKILGTILIILPGVNLVNSVIASHNMQKQTLNDTNIEKFLIKMTDQEQEQFSKLKTMMEKISFAAIATVGNEDEEYLGVIGKRPIVVDHGLSTIYYDQLLPLAYTLDEVKELNSATSYSYRIGKVDGINTAIVGIPNQNSPVNRLTFKFENYKKTHTFEKMTEEEAKDKTFVVYPFTKEEEVLACVEKIRENRHEKETASSSSQILNTNARLEALYQQTLLEEEKNAPKEHGISLVKSKTI